MPLVGALAQEMNDFPVDGSYLPAGVFA